VDASRIASLSNTFFLDHIRALRGSIRCPYRSQELSADTSIRSPQKNQFTNATQGIALE